MQVINSGTAVKIWDGSVHSPTKIWGPELLLLLFRFCQVFWSFQVGRILQKVFWHWQYGCPLAPATKPTVLKQQRGMRCWHGYLLE